MKGREERALRIGQGFDAHRFVEGRKLILGGVKIEYALGLEGHSDADVLIHALIDALLGAAGLGDIGMHFPDTDPAYRDASSLGMLEVVSNAIRSLGFRVVNLDVTVFAQKPRIAPHRAAIVENLANVLGIEPPQVNVKATTTEGLGFLGRGEGLAASAVVMLEEWEAD
jgi:2-C-methyl-D-erythritol 2,4-cyclodiphosphate synthase